MSTSIFVKMLRKKIDKDTHQTSRASIEIGSGP